MLYNSIMHAAPPDVPALFREGILPIAELPPGNPRHLDFERYTIPLLAHDYPAKTPAMWNQAYRTFELAEGNVVAIGDPQSLPVILQAFRRDPRYAGGGAGVGFKERALELARTADVIVNASTKGATGPLERYSALAPANLSGASENLASNLRAAGEILSTIPSRAILSDVVIAAGGTPFLNAARAAGFTVLDGVAMVVNQAVEAFWILHGEQLATRGISKEDVSTTMGAGVLAGPRR